MRDGEINGGAVLLVKEKRHNTEHKKIKEWEKKDRDNCSVDTCPFHSQTYAKHRDSCRGNKEDLPLLPLYSFTVPPLRKCL